MVKLKRTLLALAILSFALVVTGCQIDELRTRKVLPEWSRGQPIGVAAVNQPLSMLTKDGSVHMVWVAAGGKALHYVRLDDSGRIQIATDLEVNGAHPVYPRLLIDDGGGIRVLWMDNPRIPRALFLARLSADGQQLSEPKRLSTEGLRVAEFEIAHNADGSLDVFWATENPSDGGLYHLRLSRGDQLMSENRLLASGGEKPTVQVASDGTIHLAWVQRRTVREHRIYYAVFDPPSMELGPPTHVGFFHTGTGLVCHAPVLGLDRKMVYIIWALDQRGGGLTPGEAQTFVVSFPHGSPGYSEPVTVDIPLTAKPEYHAAAGSLPYRQLASTTAGWPTTVLYMPATLGGQGEELGVFLAGQVAARSQSSVQVVWAIFADGDIKGYQLPAQVGNAMRPGGVIDSDGNVHLAWLNTGGFGRYEVYYATTSETAKASLDKVTLQARATDLLSAAWTLAPALGFFPPIFLLWAFASFVWVVLFYVVKVEGGTGASTSSDCSRCCHSLVFVLKVIPDAWSPVHVRTVCGQTAGAVADRLGICHTLCHALGRPGCLAALFPKETVPVAFCGLHDLCAHRFPSVPVDLRTFLGGRVGPT